MIILINSNPCLLMAYFLVMLLTLMHIVYLTLKLTELWRPVRSLSMKPCFCSSPVFDCAGDREIGESIFVEEDEEGADWGDLEPTPPAAPVEPATTTLAHGPDPSSFMTWGPHELPP
jgi:hypothetical protein